MARESWHGEVSRASALCGDNLILARLKKVSNLQENIEFTVGATGQSPLQHIYEISNNFYAGTQHSTSLCPNRRGYSRLKDYRHVAYGQPAGCPYS